MGPDFLAQELGWFSDGAVARRKRSARELHARLDFEDDWDDDLDEKVAEITSGCDADGDLDELEVDEELLEGAENTESSESSDEEY